jgi:pimeloyl-ACP methyl ester carboxylesterase
MKWTKKIFWAAALLIFAAALGFWLRPVSYFNGAMYLRETLRGDASRTVQVEGYRVHYLAAGRADGRPVVLVHGLGGSCEDWRNLAPALTRAGFRVYMPDLLGYGRSERPAGFSYTVRDEASLVTGFMDALGLSQVDLGGWSMGGWIVQLVAADAPGRVKQLILFDSAGLELKPDWDTSLFTPSSAQELDELDTLLMPHPPPVPGFVARDILRISSKNGWVVQRAMTAMLTGSDVTDTLLPRLTMPILIVWGTLDRITPLDEGEKMHQLAPHSQLDLIAGCGHLAPLQCTSQITPKLVSFLEQ